MGHYLKQTLEAWVLIERKKREYFCHVYMNGQQKICRYTSFADLYWLEKSCYLSARELNIHVHVNVKFSSTKIAIFFWPIKVRKKYVGTHLFLSVSLFPVNRLFPLMRSSIYNIYVKLYRSIYLLVSHTSGLITERQR